MNNNKSSLHKLLGILRVIIFTAGVFFVALAVFAEELRLDSQKGWGTGEILLAFTGLLLIVIASLWQRFFTVYKSVSLIILNTIVLFLFIELVSLGYLNFFIKGDNETQSIYTDYYEKQDWSSSYWGEHYETAHKKYVPFVEWKRHPFSGKYININNEGLRKTTNSDCDDEALKIFLFGGSTMWGWGAPDSLTIPSILSDELKKKNYDACVYNFGEDSYTLLQNTVDLVANIQKGNIPDKTIFLIGANDVMNSFVTGNNSSHVYISDFKDKLESSGWLDILKKTNTYELIKSLKSKEAEKSDDEISMLVSETVRSILRNYLIVLGLAEKYNFSCDFFIQPVLPLGGKTLSKWEQKIFDNSKPQLNKYFTEFYKVISFESDKFDNIHNISDVFDSVTSHIYTDIMHITPYGNKMIAKKIVDTIF